MKNKYRVIITWNYSIDGRSLEFSIIYVTLTEYELKLFTRSLESGNDVKNVHSRMVDTDDQDELTTKTLARVILASTKTYEDSFDKEAAQQTLGQSIGEHNLPIDMSNFYGLTLREACEQTCKVLFEAVYLLLTNSWNDALEWAKNNC